MIDDDFPSGVTAPLVGHIRRQATYQVVFATMFLPYRGRRAPGLGLEQVDLPNGVCLTVRRGRGDIDTIWVRLRGTRAVELPGGIVTDARVCIVRRKGARVSRAMIVDGKKLVINGKSVSATRIEKLASRKP